MNRTARQIRLKKGDRRRWPISGSTFTLVHRIPKGLYRDAWRIRYDDTGLGSEDGIITRKQLLEWTVEA